MKHTLIVVDLQHDFYHPNGALYVTGGENIVNKISNIIPKFDHTIFTLDFHPISHCSFQKNGGQWPTHCVEYTKGATIPIELLEITKENVSFYRKGASSFIEEYGAFGELALGGRNEVLITERIKAVNSEFVVCGIAGDYCVLETIKNLLKLVPKEQVFVFLDGIVSIDGGEKLNNFIQENNLKIYQNDN